MGDRSSRSTGTKGRSELSCMPGLFSILESRHSRASPKMISNGGTVKKLVADSLGKIEQRPSFDEECRKIQNGSVLVDANARSVGNLIQEDMFTENINNKQIIVKGHRQSKTDSEFLNHIVKTRKKARNNSQKALSSAVYQPPSASAEVSVDKLTISGILRAVCDQNHHEKTWLSDGFRRKMHLRNRSSVDELRMRQVPMSAKTFVDQMFIDRKFKEGSSSEYKPFSNALEVLNSNKDHFMDLLREPDSFFVKCIKNLQNSQRKNGTIEFFSDESDSEVSLSTLASEKGKTKNQNQYSLTRSFTTRPSDKIVILKPALESRKCSKDVSCHCSTLQSHKRLGERPRSSKPPSFSFGEIKRKLKYAFARNRNEPSRFLIGCGENRLSPDRSILKIEEKRESFHSSDDAKTEEKLCKKEDLKSETDTARKKLDFSSVQFPMKQEFDVILEAKKHLSARLKNMNAVESTTSLRSPRTLGRILSSPEHDFWPSPRRDSLYCSGSAQMRFSPYNASTFPNGKQRTSLSPLRENKETTVLGTDEEVQNTFVAANNMKPNGELKTVERNEIRLLEARISHASNEAQSPEVSITTGTSEVREEDGSILHSTVDSISENETSACTVDDFPSTSSSIYRLDMVDHAKYQEEHQSPVSVLEPFFSEDDTSPSCTTLQTGTKQIQPHHFDFEDCSFEPCSQDPPESCTDEQDYISYYVHLVLKASHLDWDDLSEIRASQETLLHESLFDEVELHPTVNHFDPLLLFDHMNEVLLDIYQSQSHLSPMKPKTMSVPLEKQVLDEIMKEADFYLLPRTERRTLDQLVSKDVTVCRSWLNVQHDTEEIVVDISEDLMEESVLDMLLEFHS